MLKDATRRQGPPCHLLCEAALTDNSLIDKAIRLLASFGKIDPRFRKPVSTFRDHGLSNGCTIAEITEPRFGGASRLHDVRYCPFATNFPQCGSLPARCRFCCKSLFPLVIKNSPGFRRDFRATSSPEDKLADDLGNAIEGIRISDRQSDFFTAGKLAPINFWTFATISATSGPEQVQQTGLLIDQFLGGNEKRRRDG